MKDRENKKETKAREHAIKSRSWMGHNTKKFQAREYAMWEQAHEEPQEEKPVKKKVTCVCTKRHVAGIILVFLENKYES